MIVSLESKAVLRRHEEAVVELSVAKSRFPNSEDDAESATTTSFTDHFDWNVRCVETPQLVKTELDRASVRRFAVRRDDRRPGPAFVPPRSDIRSFRPYRTPNRRGRRHVKEKQKFPNKFAKLAEGCDVRVGDEGDTNIWLDIIHSITTHSSLARTWRVAAHVRLEMYL
jgi:hypothetical protein